MDERRAELVDALAEEALDLGTGERAAFLDARCGGNEAIRRDVERLLVACESAWEQRFLEELDADGESGRFDLGEGGAGPYVIVSAAESGPGGTVFHAKRGQGDATVRVLLHVFPPEPVGGTHGAEAGNHDGGLEQLQALAEIRHPNLASVLDAGTISVRDEGGTAHQVLYLATEHVAGEPLDRHCVAAGLEVERILEHFLNLCDAVGAVHARGVRHGGIRPGTVLVDPEGRAKLLDLGVATVLSREGGEIRSQAALAPECISPEQRQGLSPDLRSDIYSLGVLLYRVLTGLEPQQPGRGAALAPSRRLSSLKGGAAAWPVGWRRGLARRARRLRGDLDAIVLKALARQRELRYQSVGELAGDIRLHLRGYLVTARHDSVAGRVAKLLRRHRVGLAVTVLAAVLIAVGARGCGGVRRSWHKRSRSEITCGCSSGSHIHTRRYRSLGARARCDARMEPPMATGPAEQPRIAGEGKGGQGAG